MNDPFSNLIDKSSQNSNESPAPTQSANKTQPEAKTEAKAEPKKTTRKTASMAYHGKPVETEFPAPHPLEWGEPYQDDFETYQGADQADMRQINMELLRTARKLNESKHTLNEARRRESNAQEKYRTEFNRCLIGLSGETEAKRKAVAEVMTEEYYSDYVVARTIVEEMKNNYYTIKSYLDVLETLSHNIRAELRL